MSNTILDDTFGPEFKAEAQIIHAGIDSLISIGSDSLLVTIGDSWTYAYSFEFVIPDSLPDSLQKFRRDNAFGRILSNKLNCDWLNLGIPSKSNRWMIDQVKTLSSIREQLTYKNIYIVITLTESCREFNTHIDIDIDYKSLLKNVTTLDEIIKILSSENLNRLLNVDLKDIQLIIGRNYVDNTYDSRIDKYMLPDSWLDILLANSGVTPTNTTPCYIIGSWVIEKLSTVPDLCNWSRVQLLNEIDIKITQALERTKLFDQSKYNIKTSGYRHPTPDGHKLWAEYIFNQMKTTGII